MSEVQVLLNSHLSVCNLSSFSLFLHVPPSPSAAWILVKPDLGGCPPIRLPGQNQKETSCVPCKVSPEVQVYIRHCDWPRRRLLGYFALTFPTGFFVGYMIPILPAHNGTVQNSLYLIWHHVKRPCESFSLQRIWMVQWDFLLSWCPRRDFSSGLLGKCLQEIDYMGSV